MNDEKPHGGRNWVDLKEKILFCVILAGLGVSIAAAYWTYTSMHDIREIIEIMRHALGS